VGKNVFINFQSLLPKPALPQARVELPPGRIFNYFVSQKFFNLILSLAKTKHFFKLKAE
jgi:hypothetical protein